jgi:hypothetical protein
MPQVYKMLGSVRPTAAKKTEVFNWIKNPSFTERGLDNWYTWASDRRYHWYQNIYPVEQLLDTVSGEPQSYPATWGSKNVLRWTSEADISMGIYMSEPYDMSHRTSNTANQPHNLIPVNPYKQYNIAWSQMPVTSSTNNIQYRLYQYDGDKRWITWNDWNHNPGNNGAWNGGASKFERYFSTIELQQDCMWVSISIQTTNGNGASPYITDIYFGEYKEYAEAPFSLDGSIDCTYLYPFDKRRNGYLGDPGNSYTGRSYAGPLSLLYTTPNATQTTVSSLISTNVGKIVTPQRVALIKSGETLNDLSLKHFLRFDEMLKPQNSQTLIQGMTLSAGDKLYVAADSGEVNFKLFGAEIS